MRIELLAECVNVLKNCDIDTTISFELKKSIKVSEEEFAKISLLSLLN